MMADTPFQCTKCKSSFNSDIELSSHLDKSECHGITDGTLMESCLDASSDSEWEYEYSNTESEIIYVTLDLPVARSDANIEERQKGGRLTKRKDKWLNSTHLPYIDEKRKMHTRETLSGDENVNDGKDTLLRSRTETQRKEQSVYVASGGKKAPENGMSSENDVGTDEDLEATKKTQTSASNKAMPVSQKISTTGHDKDNTTASAQESPQSIQILELHSKNPIVVYRNQQFECNWAENIGTELLFIKHSDIFADFKANLPIVKSLPGEVDLLAVSGVRVVGHSINIKAKETSSALKEKVIPQAQSDATKKSNNHQKKPSSAGLEEPLRIPITSGASQDRKEQARFLERLAAIKLKRGEHDEVTVNAIARKVNRERKNRDQNRKKALKVLKDKSSSEQRKAFARRRLQEIDALDAKADERVRKSTGSNVGLQQSKGANENEGTRGQASSSKTVTFDSTSEGISKTQHLQNKTSKEHHTQDTSTEDGNDSENEDSSRLNSSEEDGSDEENDENSSMNDDDQRMSDFGSERDVDMGEEEEGEENVVYTPRDEDYDMDDEEGEHHFHNGSSRSGTHTPADGDMSMDDAV